MDNLLTYQRLDPDELYYKFPEGSQTFFFVPSTGNLYLAPYPTTHEDMLIEDDDLFDDVYGDLEWGPRERRQWASRGKALALTDAVLGRIAAVGEDLVVCFWKNPKSNLQGFVTKLFQKFPTLERRKDAIIVVAPQTAPYALSGRKLNPDDTIAAQDTPATAKEKKFQIAGNVYSLQDLQNLRSAVHTKNMTHGDPLAILCHPDMAKYPMLAGFRPASCSGEKGELRRTHPEKWRQAGKQIDPYLYKYGETFKEFFEKNDDEQR